MTYTGRGGKREGAGRKKLAPDEKRYRKQYWLNSKEIILMDDFLNKIRYNENVDKTEVNYD